MLIQLCRGKIHRGRITECDPDYEGSLGIDLDFLDASGILPYEKILVVNGTNGERLETYVIPKERGTCALSLNGPAAMKGRVGDIITVMAFGVFTENEAVGFAPRIIVLDERNKIVERKGVLSKS